MKQTLIVITVLLLLSAVSVSARGNREEVDGEITAITAIDATTMEITLLGADGTEQAVEVPAGAVLALGLTVGDTVSFAGNSAGTGETVRMHARTATANGETTRLRTQTPDTADDPDQLRTQTRDRTQDQLQDGSGDGPVGTGTGTNAGNGAGGTGNGNSGNGTGPSGD